MTSSCGVDRGIGSQILLFDFYCSTSALEKGRPSCGFLAPKVTRLLPRCNQNLPSQAALCVFARMIQVRHRSHATYSRQPRQVRKEATVTGSCVCSGSPVPGLFFRSVGRTLLLIRRPGRPHKSLHSLYHSLRKTPPLDRYLYRCGQELICSANGG